MKKVYICAPLGGDVKNNLEKVKRYTQYALCLDDDNPGERQIGMTAGRSLLWFCDELWQFGDEITEGMAAELQYCRHLNVKTRKVREEEINKVLGGKLL